jgi:purine nucleosidase
MPAKKRGVTVSQFKNNTPMKILFVNLFLGFQLLAGFDVLAQKNSLFPEDAVRPRMRVMIDNDFGGDPDGLFQLVHHILSPSVEIRGIIGSHIKPGGFFDAPETATHACKEVDEVLKTMNLGGKFPVYEGSNSGLEDSHTPKISDGAKAIIQEALREDTNEPFYVVCGAGLTDIASAYLMEPKIAKRLTLIWIGGPEYPDAALPPPGYTGLEYNLGIDITAGQIIFNTSDIPLWQVPRSTYRQALLSYSELLLNVKPKGEIGKYLAGKIESVMRKTQKINLQLGETYVLGDNPLVLLTALQSSFDTDPSSSTYVLKPAPKINDSGLSEVNFSARNIRIYTNLDIRLMFEDLFSKLTIFSAHK